MAKRSLTSAAALLISVAALIGTAAPTYAFTKPPPSDACPCAPLTSTCNQAGAVASYGDAYTNILTVTGVFPHARNHTIELITKRGTVHLDGSTQSDANGNYRFDIPIPTGAIGQTEKLNAFPEKNNRRGGSRVNNFFRTIGYFACLTAQEAGGQLTISYDGAGWKSGGGFDSNFYLDGHLTYRSFSPMTSTTTFSIPCPSLGTHDVSIRHYGYAVAMSFSIESCG